LSRVQAYIIGDNRTERNVTIKVVVHEADEGGFWAEVPALPGCASQGETMDDLLLNLREAIEGCLSVDVGILARRS
jgi:predicted RNase H-like HicB family nuclease